MTWTRPLSSLVVSSRKVCSSLIVATSCRGVGHTLTHTPSHTHTVIITYHHTLTPSHTHHHTHTQSSSHIITYTHTITHTQTQTLTVSSMCTSMPVEVSRRREAMFSGGTPSLSATLRQSSAAVSSSRHRAWYTAGGDYVIMTSYIPTPNRAYVAWQQYIIMTSYTPPSEPCMVTLHHNDVIPPSEPCMVTLHHNDVITPLRTLLRLHGNVDDPNSGRPEGVVEPDAICRSTQLHKVMSRESEEVIAGVVSKE